MWNNIFTNIISGHKKLDIFAVIIVITLSHLIETDLKASSRMSLAKDLSQQIPLIQRIKTEKISKLQV